MNPFYRDAATSLNPQQKIYVPISICGSVSKVMVVHHTVVNRMRACAL